MQLEDVYSQLIAPFDAKQIGLKPQSVKGDQAIALPFITARTVMNRLDQAVGPSNWSDHYEVINAGGKLAVICWLTVLGVTKEGIGEPGGTPGEEMVKSAQSDSFKRAAVAFGIGRYLYAMPKRWLRYDGRKFLEPYPGLGQDKTTPIRAAQRPVGAG